MSGGPAFTLTATGAEFTQTSVIAWNGTPLITTFVSATQLTANVSAADISTAQTDQVTVVDNGIGTNAVNFHVMQSLELYATNPSVLNVGHPSYTMTALGAAIPAPSTSTTLRFQVPPANGASTWGASPLSP